SSGAGGADVSERTSGAGWGRRCGPGIMCRCTQPRRAPLTCRGWTQDVAGAAPHQVSRASTRTSSGVSTTVAVKIRLKRFGKIRAPYYRVVVADSRTKRDGRVIEEIGKYHPTEEPSLIDINGERARYWLGVGAQPSEQVLALLKVT